jgi:hypothetical protein
VDLSLDLEKLLGIPGAQFGVEFLQFNGENTNGQAGVVTGYNNLPGPPPLDRSESSSGGASGSSTTSSSSGSVRPCPHSISTTWCDR